MTPVYYTCVGGPLDGQQVQAPPHEYTMRLVEMAEDRGVEVPPAALYIEGYWGAYVFDDDRADLLMWVDFTAKRAREILDS